MKLRKFNPMYPILIATIGITGSHITAPYVSATPKAETISQDDSVRTPTERGIYALTGVVTGINPQVVENYDLVTITTSAGNDYVYYSDSEDLYINDLVSCTMDNNGTVSIYDDKIISAYYSGTVEQFMEILEVSE